MQVQHVIAVFGRRLVVIGASVALAGSGVVASPGLAEVPAAAGGLKAVPAAPPGGNESPDSSRVVEDVEPDWLNDPVAPVGAAVGSSAVPRSGMSKVSPTPVSVGRPGAAVKGGDGDAADAPAGVRVATLPTAALAHARGVAFQVSRTDGVTTAGNVDVVISYEAIRRLYGGNFAQRLQLVSQPECVLTTPDDPACSTEVPVEALDDPSAGTLSARVDAAPLPDGADATTTSGSVYSLSSSTSVSTLAVATGGGAGSYSATPLSTTSNWVAGGSSGGFSYTYPVSSPPNVGSEDAVPDMSLHYSSQAVDGLSNASNAQASWVGMGWSLNPGYIERRLVSCAQDGYGQLNYPDMCYTKDPSFTLVMGDWSTQIVQDGANTWRLRDDRGWLVEQTTGNANDSWNGLGWRLTSPDGTRYYFGYGNARTDGLGTATNSAWTVPVYAESSGQCGYDPNSAIGSYCNRVAWRLGLDRVVDANENYATLFWATETNAYSRGGVKVTEYDRGGYLTKVSYGRETDQENASWPVNVKFTVADRCTGTTCGNYPDTPTDLACSSTASSCSEKSPSFWTKKKLVTIASEVYDGSAYAPVESYDITYLFPSPGTNDPSDPVLFLNTVKHTGRAGSGTLALPSTNFNAVELSNRADANANISHMPRVDWFRNELGGETSITYGQANPCSSTYIDNTTNAGNWDDNDRDCYPAWAYVPDAPAGQDTGIGIFNKYLVTDVQAATTSKPTIHTAYTYSGGAAWHHDIDPGSPPGSSTWSEFRGYQKVHTAVGDTTAHKYHTDTYYFRGMDGDDRVGTGTKSVTVTDADGNSYTDSSRLPGYVLDEQRRTDGNGAELVNTTYSYWTQLTGDGPGLLNAIMVRPEVVKTREQLDSGNRTRTVTTTYNTRGFPTEVRDDGGPGNSVRCTNTAYTANTALWIVDTPYQVTLDDCAGNQMAKTAFLYDGHADVGDAPTNGNVTETRRYTGSLSGCADDTVCLASTASYDKYGRVTREKTPREADAGWSGTTTTYTPSDPSVPALPTSVATTRAQGTASLTTTTTLSRAWGLPTSVTQPNGGKTTLTYDNLGRLTRVVLPGNANGSTYPNYRFTYTIAGDDYPIVRSEQLVDHADSTGSYLNSYAYFDGYGRARQTQTPSASDSTRVVVWTRFDDRGDTVEVTAPANRSGAPGSGPSDMSAAVVPSTTQYEYDPLGRRSKETLVGNGTAMWSTRTTFHGDHDTVSPPTGGDTDYFHDMLGQLTKVQQHYNNNADQFTANYAYNKRGDLTSITTGVDQWIATYSYDWLSRRTQVDDVDAGTTWTGYDADGNVTLVNSSGGEDGYGVSYTYDPLDRRIAMQKANTSTTLAAWTYDSVSPNGNGLPATSTRYDGTDAYVQRVTGYDTRGRVTGRSVTLPASVVTGGKTYDYGYTYDQGDRVLETTYPAMGNFATEKVTSSYTNLGLPATLTAPGTTYVSGTTYSPLGQILTRVAPVTSTLHKTVTRSYAWDPRTLRLTSLETKTAACTGTNAGCYGKNSYAYDEVGDVTSISHTNEYATTSQKECFTYDGLHRLTRAYTTDSTNGCTAPTSTGPTPYDLSYTYGDSRLATVVDNKASPGTTTYGYGGRYAPTSLAGPSGTTTISYGGFGQAETRTAGATNIDYEWNNEHQLATVNTNDTQKARFVYDADGNRLTRKTGGATTVYLPNAELTVANGAVTKATKYYTSGAATVAVRSIDTAGATTFKHLFGNTQSTTTLAVNDAVNDLTGSGQTSRYLPFGAHRDNAFTIANFSTDHGFLGKPEDPTGLDYLSARYYDAAAGVFNKPDPLTNLTNPQALNGYAYGLQNPVTLSDPTGLVAERMDSAAVNGGWIAPVAAALPCVPTSPSAQASAPGGLKQSWTNLKGEVATIFNVFLADPADAVNGAIEAATPGGDWISPAWRAPTNDADTASLLAAEYLSYALPLVGMRRAAMAGGAEVVGTFAAEAAAGVGARDAVVEATTEGQRFVRIGARPQNLKWTFEHPGGTAPGTYAVPEEYFNSISHDPAFLKDIFDLPDSSLPQYFRILEPPAGTPIQYGTVPGGEFGGSGGAPEVFFPKGF
jgi:RHS repeat-associated protein